MTKILIAPGYGAGWSTWNSEHAEFLLKDPTLVEMAERKAPEAEVRAYVKDKLGDEYVYTGGWGDVEVVEIPDGTQFIVNEYDGYESIQTSGDTKWVTA